MKNKTLRASVIVAVSILLISISGADSASNIPIVTALVSLGYLGLFAYANRKGV